MKNVIAAVGGIIVIVAAAFESYRYLDDIHVNLEEQEKEVVQLHQRILMSESARYAEVAKYYYELRTERELTLAELERLRLVEKQQKRIADQLLGTTQ